MEGWQRPRMLWDGTWTGSVIGGSSLPLPGFGPPTWLMWRAPVPRHVPPPMTTLARPFLPTGIGTGTRPKAVPPVPWASDARLGRFRAAEPPPSFQDVEDRAVAIRIWKGIVGALSPSDSTLAGQVARSGGSSAESILMSIFEGKATANLVKRGYAMAAYLRWCAVLARRVRALPVREDIVYQYVDELRRDGAHPTKSCSFLEALALSGLFVWLWMTGIPTARRESGERSPPRTTRRNLPRRRPFHRGDREAA